MDAEQIYEVLSAADRAGLIYVNQGEILERVLRDRNFLACFDHEATGDPELRAVALLVELDMNDPARAGDYKKARGVLAEQYPDYTVHLIQSVERFISKSGNVTWKAYDEDGEIIFLRQANKELLVNAGLWDALNAMPVGAEWDCEIVVHTTQDGNFRKVQMIEGGGVLIRATAGESRTACCARTDCRCGHASE